jgi:hypothetical protein
VYDWVIYRREVTETAIRVLAKEIGIPKTTLEEFAAGHTNPHKIWPKLRDWYIKDRQRPPDETPSRPEEIILSILHTLGTIPHHRRAEAMLLIAERYRTLHQQIGIPVPTWVEMLAEVARREISDPAGSEAGMIIPLPETKKKGDEPAPEP